MFTKVLFPIDLHEEAFSLEALQFAVEQAREADAELYVLTQQRQKLSAAATLREFGTVQMVIIGAEKANRFLDPVVILSVY